LGALRAGQERVAVLERAGANFDQLGAGCLAAWCLSTRALTLARLGVTGAQQAGKSAETISLAAGAPGPLAFSYLAQAEGSESRGARFAAEADAILCGLGLDRLGATPLRPEAPTDSPVEVRCFGGFSMTVNGRPVDLSGVKPRVRSLLRLLALNPGPIHREVLAEALWPDADAEVSRRNLHVAISSLRKVLGDHFGPGRSIIAREGDAYRLDLGEDASIDVVEFGTLLSRGRRQLVSADVDGAIDSLRRALDRHSGDLLPEDGSLELVARERDRFRTEAVNAAAALAGLYLEKKCPSDAVHACERGLQIERNCDELWRTLLDAHQEAGDRAAEALTVRRYEEVLRELNA
jgi:LuxR family transcriptional regulator, maltose regulon positive regulatory protein